MGNFNSTFFTPKNNTKWIYYRGRKGKFFEYCEGYYWSGRESYSDTGPCYKDFVKDIFPYRGKLK